MSQCMLGRGRMGPPNLFFTLLLKIIDVLIVMPIGHYNLQLMRLHFILNKICINPTCQNKTKLIQPK